jgi:F0F1-type ATP synthase alpha subunit
VQPAERGYKLSEQTALLLAAESGVFRDCQVRDVGERAAALLEHLNLEAKSIMRSIDTTGKLSDTDKFDLKRIFERFAQGGAYATHQ